MIDRGLSASLSRHESKETHVHDDPAQVGGADPKIGVLELALDHDQGDPFT